MRLDEYNARRLELITTKGDATYTAFSELEELVNVEQLALQYFDESKEWMEERLTGCVRPQGTKFSMEEYHVLAEAFRHIAERLKAHADEIDNAK